MGFVENFLPERIQVLGQTVSYLDQLGERARCPRRSTGCSPSPCRASPSPRGSRPPPYLLERAEAVECPVLRSPQSTTPFIHSLTAYLDAVFSPETTLHGSLVDVYEVGLLLTGKSGIGKSECALDLVERGHRPGRRRRGDGDPPSRQRAHRHRERAPPSPAESAASASSTCRASSGSARSACRSGSRCSATCACGSRAPSTTGRPRPAEGRGPERRDPVRAHPHRAREEHHGDRRSGRAQLPDPGLRLQPGRSSSTATCFPR